MRSRLRMLGLVGLGVTAAIALASCSSGSTNASSTSKKSTTTTTRRHGTTTTAKPTTTTTAKPTTTTTARPTTTTGAPTTTAHSTTCQVSQLQVTPGPPGGGAAGTIYISFVFTNISATTCTLAGYPGMQLLDAASNKLPTNVVRDQLTFQTPAANHPPSTVTLAPHAQATFDGAYSDVPVGGETSCPTSASTLITPPNDTTSAKVAFQATACGGGTIHVSPVFAS